MNKKIVFLALVSIVLQLTKLLFAFQRISSSWFTKLILIYLLIAIPFAIYLAFSERKKANKINKVKNTIGVLFTFPILIIVPVLFSNYSRTNKATDVNKSAITVTDDSGQSLPIDSFKVVTKKNDTGKDAIKLRKK